tara:strand:+ start:2251 stop:2490 length:240 start_codon:yes stop_codon:yes gene_type:complete
MIVVECRVCGTELRGSGTCGCSNMTSIHDDVVSANDMEKVHLLQTNKIVNKSSLLTKEDLKYQEERRKRKVRKLTFEER